MSTFCDLERLQQLAREPATLRRKGAAREMFSCIGVALSMLGRAEPVVDELGDGGEEPTAG